jgi:hypothetical protein
MNVFRTPRTLLEKSANAFWEKAEDCFNQAKEHQAIADQQHVTASQLHKNADKIDETAKRLVAFGQKLQATAIEITTEAA